MVSAGRRARGGRLLRSGVAPAPAFLPPLPPVLPASRLAASLPERRFPGPLAHPRPLTSHPGRALEPPSEAEAFAPPRGSEPAGTEPSQSHRKASVGLAVTLTGRVCVPLVPFPPLAWHVFCLYRPSPGFPWGSSPCAGMWCIVCQDDISVSSDFPI